MVGNPIAHLQRDLDAAARDFQELDTARAVEGLAQAVRDEAPYVSGYLVSTVYSDRDGVGVGAVYAGVVHDSNPYAERALDRFDVSEAFADQIDEVLDDHLQPVYL